MLRETARAEVIVSVGETGLRCRVQMKSRLRGGDKGVWEENVDGGPASASAAL